jgi:hypothetical protein
VSWGTKGDNTTQTDLGVVGEAKDKKVDVAVPEDEMDIDAAYEDALAVINRCLLMVWTEMLPIEETNVDNGESLLFGPASPASSTVDDSTKYSIHSPSTLLVSS